MKELLIALCAILAVATARVVVTVEGQDTPHLLGDKVCTWGPTFWCQNLTNAAGCKATKHCITKVWENMQVPEDTDDVCSVCKDMVQQARDQLESNQTQQDLKAVFEGSCALIHIKPIVKECDKLVDDFVPELVETLASQMNPSVVCSVAGLCNSAHIDKLLSEHKNDEIQDKSSLSLKNDEYDPDECSKCYTIANHMELKFKNTSRDNFVNGLLHTCGELGSFSDACSSLVLTHFDNIYKHLQKELNPKNICHLTSQCSNKFHVHENDKPLNVEIRPLSSVGMVEVNDDLPCKLCEQLVKHLRDVLVANTTESEFQMVLEGICKQTKSFATECKSIVDEYYPEIYSYLTKELNGNLVCEMGGICPTPGKTVNDAPIWPLLPEQATRVGLRILDEKKNKKSPENLETDEMQLPIERMHVPFSGLGFPQMDVKGKQMCAFCEYLLHYIQQAITSPATEDEVKIIIGKVCVKLPTTIQHTCSEFVDVYGDAVVAILAQEIDPSQVCPMIHVCPSTELMNLWENIPKEFTIEIKVKDKPSCPLCLLAITQIYNAIKNNKTEASIEAELDKLCSHLPKSLNDQCVDLVKGYSKELVEMLLADLTPQEVCVYIKLCDPSKNISPTDFYPMDKDGEIITNEIPDFPLHPKHLKKVVDDSECAVCQFIMQEIEKAMSNQKTRSEIEKIVHGICNYMPKHMANKCNNFVNEYADMVIQLLADEVSPKEICTIIGMCTYITEQMKESVSECAVCQMITSQLNELLNNSKVVEQIEETVSKICKFLPASKINRCTMMMEVYEQSIINIIKSHGEIKKICSKLALCSNNDYLVMSVVGRVRRSAQTTEYLGKKPCTWGPSYWCGTKEQAIECQRLEHCQEKIWKGESPPTASKQSVSPSTTEP